MDALYQLSYIPFVYACLAGVPCQTGYVELTGFEPVASCLQSRHSTN